VKEDRPVLAREIATLGKIPGKYLSKVMRDLVHAGVFSSTRGIGGGFRLRRRAETIKLADVIRPFDDVLAARRCPFGNSKCSDDSPCSMHEQWKPVSEAVRNLLEKTTVADIVKKDAPIRFDAGKKKGKGKVKASSSDRA
jgi:Rrf2 family protein